MVRKSLCLLFIFSAYVLAGTTAWYERNTNLKKIFAPEVWTCVEKAALADSQGNEALADKFLRKAEQMTFAAEPFGPKNWPSHWPRTQEALDLVRYAPPSAYIERILGDYALQHNRPKEAIRFFQAYQQKCIIPDAAYLVRLAETLEAEKLYPQAIEIYEEILLCLQTKNFHNEPMDTASIPKRIRLLRARLQPMVVLPLDMKTHGIPSFLSDVDHTFKEKLSKIGNSYSVVPDRTLDKALAENMLTRAAIVEDIEERDRIVKVLNVDYIIEPSLIKVENLFVFQVRVYRAGKHEPEETYEYKHENYEFLPNYFDRFVLQFEGKSIPSELLIPGSRYLWSFETADQVASLAVSENGTAIVAGCKNGNVYVFNKNGGLRRTYHQQDEILKVGISPDGGYAGWCGLNGFVTLEHDGKILYRKKIGNLGRGVSIGQNGKFWIYSVNDRIVYLDSRGEVFWERKLSDWVESLRISPDCSLVAVGTSDGSFMVLNNEGNLLWSKTVGNPVVRISFSPAGRYIVTGMKNGIVTVYTNSGEQTLQFTVGDETKFFSYNTDLLLGVSGVWNDWFYFPDNQKKNLWNYSVEQALTSADASIATNLLVVSRGKSVFAYAVRWE